MAYLDAQVYHIAGLIGAGLGTTLCKRIFRHPLPRPPADVDLPCVAVYREKETWEGTVPGFREFDATLQIKYYMGRQSFGVQLEEAWGALHDIVRRIDQLLILGEHASYSSGQNLTSLAGVAFLEAGESTYSGELPEQPGATTAYPSVTIAARLVHHETSTISDEEALAKMVHHFDVDAHPSWAKTATLNAVAPACTATWIPVVSGVSVVIAVGASLSVSVADRVATVTLVPGTTTYAQIASAWNAEPDAVALATISGTAGTVSAGYPGEALHLWYDSNVFGFDAVVTEVTF